MSEKSCRENQYKHFVLNPPPENRAVYETTWRNVVERGSSQVAMWHMRIALWIPKAKYSHPE